MPKQGVRHLPDASGRRSFCGAAAVDEMSSMPKDARIAFLGIPFDGGTVYRPGSRLGPDSIREASSLYGSSPLGFGGFYDIEVGRVLLSEVRMVDVGDVRPAPSGSDLLADSIAATVGELLDRGLFVVVAGGDHSVSYPVIRAQAGRGNLNVVQLDAHLDFREEVSGDRYTQGSPMRRASELEGVDQITQVGTRGLLNSPVSHLAAIEAGNTVVTTRELRRMGAEETMGLVPPGDCYVTIDADVFDPSIAPGTGTPEPGGLFYDEMKALLAALAGRGDIRVRGFDFVEVNPMLDQSGTTALLASRVILDFLGLIWAEDAESGDPVGRVILT